APGRAKVTARSCWSSASTWTPTWSPVAITGQLELAVPMPNESIGGSAETEAREVAVKPTGPEAPRAVITATPAACRRNTERSRSGEAGRAWVAGGAVMELSFRGRRGEGAGTRDGRRSSEDMPSG